MKIMKMMKMMMMMEMMMEMMMMTMMEMMIEMMMKKTMPIWRKYAVIKSQSYNFQDLGPFSVSMIFVIIVIIIIIIITCVTVWLTCLIPAIKEENWTPCSAHPAAMRV